MPALRAGIDAAGWSSDGCTSQYDAVPGMVSAGLAGQAGTENAAVDASDAGGMICDVPARKAEPEGTVTPMM